MSLVVLEPVTVSAPFPVDFTDIDALVEQQENDPAVRDAIASGRRAVAENYYADCHPLSWYRLRRGWSQKELATRMHTSQSYIARLEAGEIDPQVSTLQRLAAALNAPASELLDAVTAGAQSS